MTIKYVLKYFILLLAVFMPSAIIGLAFSVLFPEGEIGALMYIGSLTVTTLILILVVYGNDDSITTETSWKDEIKH